MKKYLQFGLITTILISLSACSGSTKEEGDDEFLDEIPVSEADTDELPMDAEEGLEDLEDGDLADSLGDEEGAEDALADAAGGLEDDAMAAADSLSEGIDDAETNLEEGAGDMTAGFDSGETGSNTFEDPSTDSSFAAADTTSYGGGGTENYTVQSGDTLMKIAFEVYADMYQWRRIYNQNRDRISNPNRIPEGTVLKVEQPSQQASIDRSGERYLIKNGDTLGTISNDIYGTPKKWRRLWKKNSQLIKDPDKIYAGFYLYYDFSDQDRQDKMSAPLASSRSAPAPTPPMPSSSQPLDAGSGTNSATNTVPAKTVQPKAPVEEAAPAAGAGAADEADDWDVEDERAPSSVN